MPQLRDIPRRPKLPSNEPTMAVPPKQQPTPPSRHPPQPPPMPSAGATGPNIGPVDAFSEMISGPVITVQVGPQSFTLPMKLLARYSAFFRNEIMCRASPINRKRKQTPKSEDRPEKAVKVEEKETENVKDTAKEHAKPTDGAGDVTMANPEANKEQETPKTNDNTMDTAHHDAATTLLSIKEEEKVPEPEPNRIMVNMRTHYIDCSDIDPAIFGLFLKFIYTGFYPVQVDARPRPMPSMAHMSHPTSAPNPGPLHMSSPYTQPGSYAIPFEDLSKEEKAHHMLAILTAPKENGFPKPVATSTPPTTKSAPPAAATGATGVMVVEKSMSMSMSIPPSIHAYLLAHRLGSPSFMNHTIHHVYHAIGRDFELTPGLVDWVWRRTAGLLHGAGMKKGSGTCPTPSGSTPPPASTSTSTSSVPSVNASGSGNGNGNGNGNGGPPIHPPYPLRKLILDILIQHWSSTSTHIIARNQGVAWNKVFDWHGELRHEFMMGLQGGVKVGVVEGYYVRARA